MWWNYYQPVYNAWQPIVNNWIGWGGWGIAFGFSAAAWGGIYAGVCLGFGLCF